MNGVLDNACKDDNYDLSGIPLRWASCGPKDVPKPVYVSAVPRGDHDPQGEYARPEYESSAKGDGGGANSRWLTTCQMSRLRKVVSDRRVSWTYNRYFDNNGRRPLQGTWSQNALPRPCKWWQIEGIFGPLSRRPSEIRSSSGPGSGPSGTAARSDSGCGIYIKYEGGLKLEHVYGLLKGCETPVFGNVISALVSAASCFPNSADLASTWAYNANHV